ncbi:TrkH family potassium uptake protein, partial [Thioclava sp. BHET1]
RIGIATLNYDSANMARRHLISIVSSYFVLPLAAALPFALSVPTTTFFNAWFEMISCFTTTGATLYEGAGRLPASVQLWRAMVGWLGGFYILLIAMAVLAPMNLGGFEVLSAGQVGRNTRDTQQITRTAYPSERLARYAVLLFPAYGGLTLLLWIGLLTVGEPNLIALCHAMSTLSTSGITPGLAPNESPGRLPAEMLIFIFLLFSISRHFWPSTLQIDRKGRLIDDPEVWLGLTTVLIVAVFLFLRHWQTVYVPGAPNSLLQAAAALWANLFTVLSFLSTTGYVASGWNAAQTWSGLHAPGLLLVS